MKKVYKQGIAEASLLDPRFIAIHRQVGVQREDLEFLH